jgi:phospholipid/cholesterol/gamma-HCH transport system substrate-binding protein
MERKINYAIVGLFVLLLGGAWLGISLWLTLGDFRTEYTTYRVFMKESVSGLYVDAPVKYRGVEIGKVRNIELNPANPEEVRLTLDIQSSVPIKVDTIAILAVQGLTGIAFVDLTGGSTSAALLQPEAGAEYPVIPSGPSFFARLDTFGMELLANLNTLANRLGELLDEEGRGKIRDILENSRQVSAVFARQNMELEQTIRNASKLFADGAEAAEQVQPLLSQIETTAAAFEEMANRIAEASVSVNRFVQGSETGLQQFTQQTLPEVGELVSELRRLADTMQDIGEKLEDDPSLLIYGRERVIPGPGE